MAQDVFRIQGVVELVADRAHRTLVTFQRTVTQSSRTMQNAFAGLDRAVGSFAAAFTGLQFQKLAGAFIQASIKAETFRTQLDLIVKDQQKINNLITFVEQYEAKTPFNLPELQKATVLFTKLTKVRDESIEKVPEYLKLAAEMSAIFDKPLEKATEGLFKTFSGSALGLTILRNNFAITKAELQKFGVAFDNSGRIKNFSQQIDVVEQAIRKIIMGLSGMKLAEARSFTLAGRIEKLGSEVYRTARIFGDVMAPYVGTIIDRLVDLQQALQNLSPEMKFLIASFVGFGAALGTLILTFGPVLYFLSMGVQGMMAFGTATRAAAGTAGLLNLTSSFRALLMLNVPLFFKNLFTGMMALRNGFSAVGWFAAITGEIAMAITVSGGLANAILNVTTQTVSAGMAAVSTTALFRAGLMSVAGAAIYLLSQLQKLTQWMDERNKQENYTLGSQDVIGFKNAINTAEKERGVSTLPPDGEVYSASMDASSATLAGRLGVLRTREMEDRLDRLGGSEGIKKNIEIIEKNLAAQRARLGDQETYLPDTGMFAGLKSAFMPGSTTQREVDLKRMNELLARQKKAQEAERKLAEASIPKDRLGAEAARYGKRPDAIMRDIQKFQLDKAEQKELADLQEKIARSNAINNETFERGTKKAKEALAYYKELLPVAEDIEKAYEGMSLAESQARFDELKRDEKLDKQSVAKTVKELSELRKNGYDYDGRLKVQYKEFDKKIELEIFKYADKLMAEKHAKLDASASMIEARGEMTAAKELEMLRARQKAIQDTANESGVLTDKMRQEYSKLAAEEFKLRNTVMKERRSMDIEVRRVTEGEHVARLALLNDETREKKKAGNDQIEIQKWRAHEELKIEQDRIQKVREVEREILDIRRSAAEAQANAQREAADWAYNRGGSLDDVIGANRESDDLEDARAREARDRAIEDAKERAKTDLDYAKKSKEAIRAIEERYRAEQEARNRQRTRRDVELEEKDEQRKAEQAIAMAEITSQANQAELERLRQMQEEGVNVHDQIVQKLREQYQFEIGIINAKAAAEKIGKSIEQQKIIDMQASQSILELTRTQTAEMQKQLDMKKKAEDEKRNRMFFKGGHMTMEEMAELDKQREAESRNRYRQMVDKEKMRGGGGPNQGMLEAANKLGVPGEVSRQALNIIVPTVKVAPIEINGNFTLTDPYGNRQTIRQKTSTEKKNEDTKSNTNQKGKNVL